MMQLQATFETLNCSEPAGSRIWHGALVRLFRICRELVTSMNADIRAGLLPAGFCARSNILSHPEFGGLNEDVRFLLDHYPIEVESPFEGVETISGGVWHASRFCEEDAVDALLKLRFLAGTTNLPMHTHDHSDRVILVAAGSGFFELQSESSRCEVISTEVKAGDALVFARGSAPAFNVPSTDLVLLSYHSPFIPLTDPRQFTITQQ